jgi:hypothetical protein
MKLMKKRMLAAVAAVICVFGVSSESFGQTALFTYNDGSGTPDAGTYNPGDSFTFSINLTFAPGGSVVDLDGLSYWFQQKSPASPFIASITLRDVTGSAFTDLQTPGLTYPQSLNPSNANDLGAMIASPNPALGAGTHFIANITMKISDTAPIIGTFVLDDVLSGGKTSVISDSMGHTFAIPEADYTITMVPEPATWVGAALTLLVLGFSQRRRLLRQFAKSA